MTTNTSSQPVTGSSSPAAAGTEPKAAELAQARFGYWLIANSHNVHEQFLVEHLRLECTTGLTKAKLAERTGRLKPLARAKGLYALMLIWTHSPRAAQAGVAGCHSAADGVMTTHRLARELEKADTIELAFRAYYLQLFGELPPKSGKYRQLVKRLVDDGVLFGLITTEDATESGKPTKRLFATDKLDELMIAAGKNAAMLAAAGLQSGNGQPGTPGADCNR